MEEKQSALVGSTSDKIQRIQRLPVPCAVPWLVMPYEKGMKHQDFYNPADKSRTNYKKSIPELNGKRFWQKNSNQGWLVIVCKHKRYDYNDKDSLPANSKYGDCFLWNPTSLQIIGLPSILRFISMSHRIIDCALSSPPSLEADNDSMVYFLIRQRDRLHNGNHKRYVLVHKSLREQQWKECKLHGDNYDDIEFDFGPVLLPVQQGKLYAMGASGMQYLEVKKQQDRTLAIRPFRISQDIFYQRMGTGLTYVPHYVESCGEVFRVDLNSNADVVTSVEIFKLDFTLVAWIEVKSLGDHVFFLSPYTSLSCSAAKIGFTRGCVFCILEWDEKLYMFDVEDNCIKVVSPYIRNKYKFPRTSSWLMIPATVLISVDRTTSIQDWFRKAKDTEDHKQEQQYETEVACRETNSSASITENHGILDVLSHSLHPVDYIHFRSTCKAIQLKFLARNWRLSSTLTTTATNLSPWLVFSKCKDPIFSFVNPMHKNEDYFMNLPELLIGATIRFSKDGWLLMSKGENIVFFYNPFTKDTIKLPDLPEGKVYRFGGISFTSLPTYSDCIVFAISDSAPDEITIATIKRGNNTWTFDVVPPQGNDELEMSSCFNSPVFWNGTFHCIDYEGTLRSFYSDGSIWRVLISQPGIVNSDYPSFLLKCEEDLILVSLHPPFGKSIKIYRLDSMKEEWVQVQNLGMHVFFISYTSSFSAIAPPNSHMENKIYFPRMCDERILFYCLDTGKYHTIDSRYSSEDFDDSSYYEYINCSWIEPNWSSSAVQELDWLN